MFASQLRSGRTTVVQVGLRAVAVGGLVTAILLSLSDRAPGLLYTAALRLDLADEIRAASFGLDPFLVGHFALWAALAGVTLLALAQWPSAALGALVGLFGLSVAVEEAQRRFTSSRGFELQDVFANGAGLAVGALLFSAVATARSPGREQQGQQASPQR